MQPDIRQDALAVIRARAGHPAALATLYDGVHFITSKLASKFARDARTNADYNEIASSSVASAVATFCLCRHYSRHGRFTTYAYKIARNRILDEIRRHKRQPQTVSYSQMTQENPLWMSLEMNLDVSAADVENWASTLRPMHRAIVQKMADGEPFQNIEAQLEPHLTEWGTTLQVEIESIGRKFAQRFMGCNELSNFSQ